MTAKKDGRPDDVFPGLLAAWDEALGGGGGEPPEPPPELRRRLERGLACVELLRAVLRPGETPPPTPAAESLGRFRILRELGRGGCGVVFLAHDPHLGREVALKVPRPEALAPEGRARFLREARAAAGLDHPNLVPVYEAGEAGPICYIASAYCPGPTLAEWLKRRGSPVPPADAARLVAALADAVRHAHERGVVHRDLKPANILLSGEKGDESAPLAGRTPKVADFGLAKLLDAPETAPTASGAVLGTPEYMAPEQAAGKPRAVGPAADVYALGTILYELLTGRPPFRAETPLDTLRRVVEDEPAAPRRLAPGCPRDLEIICLKCLEKEPSRRYAGAAALAADLQRHLDGRPILARPAGPLRRGVKWARRKPAWAALLGVGLLAAVAAAAGAFWHTAEVNALSATVGTQQDLLQKRERNDRQELYGVVDEAWLQSVADLPAPEQAAAVARMLRRRNPGLDGPVKPQIQDGVVTGLEFPADEVTDLSPLRALTGLRELKCIGNRGNYRGKLSDLSPLHGLPLTVLDCGCNQVADLSPLKGMPLTALSCPGTRISDLSPLKGMALRVFSCNATPVADLSPLEGMPLTDLYCAYSRVSDLSPLKGMALQVFDCAGTPVTDLSPLRGMPLTLFHCYDSPLSDLSPLRGAPLRKTLAVRDTKVADLSPLRGAPLKELFCYNTQVSDLSPLTGMPLEEIACDVRPGTDDLKVLRSLPSLKTINGGPAARLWGSASVREKEGPP